MPEAMSADICKLLLHSTQPPVLAFGAADLKDDVIARAKVASAQIYVDRLGDADNPEAWQKAIDAGAAGIQSRSSTALQSRALVRPGGTSVLSRKYDYIIGRAFGRWNLRWQSMRRVCSVGCSFV
jgi:hypothetical protein